MSMFSFERQKKKKKHRWEKAIDSNILDDLLVWITKGMIWESQRWMHENEMKRNKNTDLFTLDFVYLTFEVISAMFKTTYIFRDAIKNV